MTTRRTMATLLAGAMLTTAVSVAGSYGGGACNRECLHRAGGDLPVSEGGAIQPTPSCLVRVVKA